MNTLSCLAFARENNCGGTLLGTEFLGQTLDQLNAELKRLKMPVQGFTEGMQAWGLRAGGKERVRKLELITAFMQSAGIAIWNHDAPEGSLSRSLKASMDREDIALGKMPDNLANLHLEHATSLAEIDALADALEAGIEKNDEIEVRVRNAVYESGAGDKDFRHALDAADVRARIRQRFADGMGKIRERTSVAGRIDLWNLIIAKFKKPKKAA